MKNGYIEPVAIDQDPVDFIFDHLASLNPMVYVLKYVFSIKIYTLVNYFVLFFINSTAISTTITTTANIDYDYDDNNNNNGLKETDK